jgi:hypothetical protein
MCALLYLLTVFPVYYNLIQYYQFSDWSAPIQSIKLFASLSLPLSIGVFALLASLSGLLFSFGISLVMLAISKRVGRAGVSILASNALFTTMFALSLLGISIADLTFCAGFVFYQNMARSTLQQGIVTFVFLGIGTFAAADCLREIKK